MHYIKCPECGSDVPITEDNCKTCGYPMLDLIDDYILVKLQNILYEQYVNKQQEKQQYKSDNNTLI